MKNFFFAARCLVPCCCLALLEVCITNLMAQPLPFERVTDTPVWHDTTLLRYAWAGGLNNPQFSAIDLNNDGKQDLAVFDRAGNKIIPFLHNGDTVPNLNPYLYAPQYADYFPSILHDWVLLADYTADSLPDIFTYGSAGIAVYRAHRNTDNSIAFALAAPQLRYIGLSGSPLNIPSSTIEIPTLIDINGDGDLDILNFDSGGTHVEYFENQSQELTGTPADTLWFLRYDKCWGDFTENPFSNQIQLFADCNDGIIEEAAFRRINPEMATKQAAALNPPLDPECTVPKAQLHTGSSLLAFDADNDADTDLLVGDVLGTNLALLTNGNADDALMVAKDTLFPSASGVPVNMRLFPAAFHLDTNNDALPDLLIAPNDATSQSAHFVWRYLYSDTATAMPPFVFDTDCFLLCDMIDAGVRSYPVFVDYNADGKLDLLIGNHGYYDATAQVYRARLMLYENIGQSAYPAFRLVTDDFGELSAYNLEGIYPAFADLDNDGDLDMISGSENGSLHFFRNTALPASPMQLEADTFNLLEIANGDSATPCFFDVDSDGRSDLIVGEKAGKLNFFRNITTGLTPQFETTNTFWGQVDVRTGSNPFGYSAAFVARLTDTDTPYLLVNSESGRVFAYTDLTQTTFTALPDIANNLNEGGRGGIAIADINNNGTYEIVIGNRRGGVSLFSQTPGVPLSVGAIPTTGDDKLPKVQAFYHADTHEIVISIKNAPASINGGNRLTMQLYDLLGRRVASIKQPFSTNGVYAWQIDSLPTGLYVLRVDGITMPNAYSSLIAII